MPDHLINGRHSPTLVDLDGRPLTVSDEPTIGLKDGRSHTCRVLYGRLDCILKLDIVYWGALWTTHFLILSLAMLWTERSLEGERGCECAMQRMPIRQLTESQSSSRTDSRHYSTTCRRHHSTESRGRSSSPACSAAFGRLGQTL